MPNIQEILIKIISELSRIQSLPFNHRDENDKLPWPRMIGLGDGSFIRSSKEIDQCIADISRAMYSISSLQSQFRVDEYTKLVRSAFGPALATIDSDADPTHTARSILADVEAKVAENVGRILNEGGREYAFGCTLFSFEDYDPFDIGPVRFEPREIWLNRKSTDGCWAREGRDSRIQRFDHQIADGPISKIAKRRIIRAWRGEKLRGRKSSFDSHCETEILKSIGDCSYVCSVKLQGFGSNFGQDKAIWAARLAITSVSLIWENPSRALRGINFLFDREIRRQSVLFFTSDGLMRGGGMLSNMPHAPWVNREELKNQFHANSDVFAVSGEVIDWFLSPSGNHCRPDILNILAQAMLWFHDGCRADTDLFAIVSFASCMEILASGRGRGSIRKLIFARLGVDESAKIHRDGLTVKEVIDQIYDEGRTRFLHGPMRNGRHVWEDRLGHDWSSIRRLAEWFARRCLISCMEWAANNPESNDAKQLLQ